MRKPPQANSNSPQFYFIKKPYETFPKNRQFLFSLLWQEDESLEFSEFVSFCYVLPQNLMHFITVKVQLWKVNLKFRLITV